MFIQVHVVTCSSNITNQNVIDLMIRPELKSTHKFFTIVAMKQFNIAYSPLCYSPRVAINGAESFYGYQAVIPDQVHGQPGQTVPNSLQIACKKENSDPRSENK